jgi:hypothetical protein
MKAVRRGGLLAVVAAVALLVPTGAYASPNGGALVIQANGTFSPGLNTTANIQQIHWAGLALGSLFAVPGTSAGLYNCNFNGTSTAPETIAVGQAALNGICAGPTGVGSTSISCSITWTRVGPIVFWTWTCSITTSGPLGSGSGNNTAAGIALITPTSPSDTVVSYALTGTAVLLGT